MQHILSIDPSGDIRGDTGISLIGYDDNTPAHGVASWAIPGGIEAFRTWLDNLTDQFGDYVYIGPTGEWADDWLPRLLGEAVRIDIVIVEQFINRQIKGADISPLGMQYIVQWVWPNAVLSPASGKNTAVPDSVLKALGLYDDKSHHHDVREASRHAVWWLKKQKHLPTLKEAYPNVGS